jgi:hypothetical protein
VGWERCGSGKYVSKFLQERLYDERHMPSSLKCGGLLYHRDLNDIAQCISSAHFL